MTKLKDVDVIFRDSVSNDAFSRLRTSDPMTIFSVQQQYDNSPIQMESGFTGNGIAPSHDANTRMSTISVGAGTGTSFMQSYQYIPYQPGKSQLIKITGVMRVAVANTVTEYMYGDSENGYIFRQASDGTLSFVRRTKTSGSVVEEVVTQANWNIDKMDGTGVSGHNFNVANSFIFVMDGQFLGMGRVRMCFDWNGIIYEAHEFRNANNMAVPHTQTFSLPVQCLVTATGSGATKTAYLKCVAIESEGGFLEDYGYPFTTPVATATAGNSTFVHILSLRPKLTFNSKTNRSQLILVDFDITVTGNTGIDWILCTGSTFSVAPTFADVDTTYSSMEYGTGGTVTTTGLRLHGGFCPAAANSKNSVSQSLSLRNPITLNRAGLQRTEGTLSVFVSGNGATSATRALMNFKEIR